MKISLIQTSLAWEDAAANRANFATLANAIKETDLIVLPEMFATGFSMNPEKVAEKMDGLSVQWMQDLATQKNCAVAGSLVIEEDGSYYNRMFFVFPDKQYKTYDKRHLFTLAGEDKVYTRGNQKLIVDYKGWKICPFVCYDLRFPVFSRNTEGYDLLIYSANWPEVRTLAWDTLLRARAIENQAYTVGLNRIGQDGNGHNYIGHSQVVDALGTYILEPQEDEVIVTVEINKASQDEIRSKLAFLNDKDIFALIP
ncbi:amidohydrolase [Flavobacterium zepuense]|uniref:Omega-amidase YafV n=1 Tax=Flavobacterium zepuense TaxID=2593302 RepID=A0A552UWR6_9FLAO|nr:amidohydrolase [Flavobacterium zepuense]TRW22600.1 amidohydrolase [Flavobacterium zepuense]